MLFYGFPLDISVVEESAYPGAVAYACITKLYRSPLLFSLYKIVPGVQVLHEPNPPPPILILQCIVEPEVAQSTRIVQ